DKRDLVHHLRHPRQVLAQLDAPDVGADRLELATELSRGGGLHVPGVDRGQPTVQEQVDERDTPALPGWRRGGFELKQPRQAEAQAEQAGRAQVEKVAATDAVAEGGTSGHDVAPQSHALHSTAKGGRKTDCFERRSEWERGANAKRKRGRSTTSSPAASGR